MALVGSPIGKPWGRRLPVSAGALLSNFVTWNPADKSALIDLSGGNLIATRSATSSGLGAVVRSPNSSASTKLKFEVTIGPGITSAGEAVVGLSVSGSPTNNFLNGTTQFGWYSDGSLAVNGASGTAFDVFLSGDVLSIEIDRATNSVFLQKNGGFRSAAYTLSAGIYLPSASLANAGTSVTANFGGSAWVIPATSGYVGWS